MNRLLRATISLALLASLQKIQAEESSILDDPLVTVSTLEVDSKWNAGPKALIDKSFGTIACYHSSGNDSKETAIYFPKEVQIISSFVMNRPDYV